LWMIAHLKIMVRVAEDLRPRLLVCNLVGFAGRHLIISSATIIVHVVVKVGFVERVPVRKAVQIIVYYVIGFVLEPFRHQYWAVIWIRVPVEIVGLVGEPLRIVIHIPRINRVGGGIPEIIAKLFDITAAIVVIRAILIAIAIFDLFPTILSTAWQVEMALVQIIFTAIPISETKLITIAFSGILPTITMATERVIVFLKKIALRLMKMGIRKPRQ